MLHSHNCLTYDFKELTIQELLNKIYCEVENKEIELTEDIYNAINELRNKLNLVDTNVNNKIDNHIISNERELENIDNTLLSLNESIELLNNKLTVEKRNIHPKLGGGTTFSDGNTYTTRNGTLYINELEKSVSFSVNILTSSIDTSNSGFVKIELDNTLPKSNQYFVCNVTRLTGVSGLADRILSAYVQVNTNFITLYITSMATGNANRLNINSILNSTNFGICLSGKYFYD